MLIVVLAKNSTLVKKLFKNLKKNFTKYLKINLKKLKYLKSY